MAFHAGIVSGQRRLGNHPSIVATLCQAETDIVGGESILLVGEYLQDLCPRNTRQGLAVLDNSEA